MHQNLFRSIHPSFPAKLASIVIILQFGPSLFEFLCKRLRHLMSYFVFFSVL